MAGSEHEMTTIQEYRKEFTDTLETVPDEITSPGPGHSSSKDLTGAEWVALRWFLDPEAEGVILSAYGERAIDAVIAAAMPEQDKLL